MIIVKDHHLTTVFPAVCDFLCAWFSASTSVISKWKCLLENCKKVFEFPLSQITTCLLVAVGRHSQLPAVFILFWLILLSLLSRFRFSIKFIDDFYPAKVPLCLKKRDEKEENQVGHMVTWKHYSNINIFTTGLLSAHIWKRLLIHDTRLPSPWLMVIILLTLLLLLLL